MEKYDYLTAVTADVTDYINGEIDLGQYETADELKDELNERLFVNDSVTGNASGSYTFSACRLRKIFATISTYWAKPLPNSAAILTTWRRMGLKPAMLQYVAICLARRSAMPLMHSIMSFRRIKTARGVFPALSSTNIL